MPASLSVRQLLAILADAFNVLKAQVADLGGPIDAPTRAEFATQLATKASKQDIANLIGAAPAALDTLAEIDAQIKTDEQGAAAILATQQQHTQQLAALIRVPAYTSADYGKVLGLTAAGVLAWVAAPAGSGGAAFEGTSYNNASYNNSSYN